MLKKTLKLYFLEQQFQSSLEKVSLSLCEYLKVVAALKRKEKKSLLLECENVEGEVSSFLSLQN